MSMSSIIRLYIGVLEAILIDGTGLQPKQLPRPVVKTIMFAPPATMPVTLGGSKPGGVHQHQALCGHGFGVLIDFVQRRRARFGDRPERLFGDGRQPARFVADRRVVVQFRSEDARVPLPPLDPLEQLVGHRRRAGAACEEMFRPP